MFPESINYISSENGGLGTPLEASRAAFEHGLITTVSRYKAIDVNVYIAMDNPQQRSAPIDSLRVAGISSNTTAEINKMSVLLKEHRFTQDYVNTAIIGLIGKNAKIINFDDALCEEGVCHLVKGNKFTYYDSHHLSVHGAHLIYPILEKYLASIVAK